MPLLTNNTPQTADGFSIAGSNPNVIGGTLSAAAGGDPLDYYKFTTSAVSNLNLTLGGLTGNARMRVFQAAADGSLGSQLASNVSSSTAATINSGNLSESFIFNGLVAGSYFVQVDLGAEPASDATAAYTLSGLASVDGVSSSIAWRFPGNTPLAFWKMNGAAYQERGEFFGGFEIVGSGDFDGDKTTDLLWRQTGVADSQMQVWLMNSDNTVKTKQQINLPGQANTVLPSFITVDGVQDLNGDSKADIIWRDTAGNVYFWVMDSTTVVGSATYFGLQGYDIVGYGDFNADGKTDVLWQNKAAGLTAVWLMNGGQTLATGFVNSPQAMTSRYSVLKVGDLDADTNAIRLTTANKKSDVVWYDNLTGEVVLWLMDGLQLSRQQRTAPVLPSSGWVFAAAGDVSGDGNIDIVWRNVFSGSVGLWFFESFFTKTAEFATNPILPGFKIEGLADLNGDGAQDILWRWDAPPAFAAFQDTVAIWFMGEEDSSKPGRPRTKTRSEPFLLNVGAPAYTVENFRRMPQGFQGRFLTSQFAKVDQATAGSSIATAFNIGVLDGEGNYQDSVTPDTPAAPVTDFYKFKLDRTTKTSITTLASFGGAASSNAAFRLSREVTGTNGAITLEQVTTFPANATLAPGVYYIEVKTTGVTNPATQVSYNLKVKGEPIVVNLLGDGLTVRDVNNSDAAVTLANLTGNNTPKTPAKIEYKIKNTEISNSGPVRVRFYISRDTTIDLAANSRDVLIGEKLYEGSGLAGVPAITTITDTADVELPAADSAFWTTDTNYYVGMVIDPVSQALPQGNLVETNEDDNFNQGLLKDVDVILINNTQIPDLKMNLISGPATIVRGATAPTAITVNYTVRNDGKRGTGSINPDVGLNFYLYAQNPDTNLPAEQRNRLDVSSPLTKALASGNGNFLITENVAAESNVQEQVTLSIPAANDPYWSQFAPGTVFFIGSVLDQGNTFTESFEGDGSNLNRGIGLDRFQVTVQ
jgi:hypothetical protein